MQRASAVAIRRVSRAKRWAQAAFAVCAVAFAPRPAAMLPNAVVSGSRPSPYGFCIPTERYQELRRHHSLAIWIPRPLTAAEFCSQHWFPTERLAALRAFNRECGLELPEGAAAEWPTGVPIWLPPDEPGANCCCVWIWSMRDGWVSTQSDRNGLRDVAPTYAHAASDSGSIDVVIFPVPVRLQREWQRDARRGPPPGAAESVDAGLSAGPNALPQRLPTAPRPMERHFAFSQWVGERSSVARTIVELPIAEIDGRVQFAAPPTVHWLDASGKATSPYDPPSSPMVQLLVAAMGGALVAYLVLVSRRRWQGVGR